MSFADGVHRPDEEESTAIYTEDVHPMDAIRIPAAARKLLDALARMNHREHLSLNVRDAESELETLVTHHERGRA